MSLLFLKKNSCFFSFILQHLSNWRLSLIILYLYNFSLILKITRVILGLFICYCLLNLAILSYYYNPNLEFFLPRGE
jgi:hypothetical protein